MNFRFRDPTKKKNPTYENIVNESDHDLSEDERLFEEQQEFEEHFNYRFEEPDQEFVKILIIFIFLQLLKCFLLFLDKTIPSYIRVFYEKKR